jgi:TRAP transporter TAXI family solute receptor
MRVKEPIQMLRNRGLKRAVFLFASFPTLIAIALAIAVLAALAFRFANELWVLSLAAAGSSDIAFAEAVEKLHKGFDRAQIRVVRTDDASAASSAVDDGKADFAIVRSDVAVPKRAGTMLIVHRDAALLFATPRAKIAKVTDLTKKRVAIVPADPANVRLFDALLGFYGVNAPSVIHLPLAAEQVTPAAASTLFDAVFLVQPLKAPSVEQVRSALSSDKAKAPFIEFENAEAVAERLPGLSKVDIPAGFFGGAAPQPKEDASTVGVDHQLVAALSIPEGTVDAATKWLFSMRRALAAQAPVAAYMEAPATEKGAPFALHPGATAYYQDTEKSFMDQYGDWFYILAMVLGGLGSLVATLVSRLQAHGRRAAMAVIDELIKIEVAARQAASLAVLKDLDSDVTRVALESLHRARESRFDETGLETVCLAIEEARRAIAVRRAELQEAPDVPSGAVAAFPVRRTEPSAV